MTPNPSQRMEPTSEAASHAIKTKRRFVTVDSESTMDMDDAIWIERTVSGINLSIAIADPTSSVAIGSPMDERARLQAATVYVRDRAVRPMLPPFISTNQHSLIVGKRRDVFLIELALDPTLSIIDTQIARTQIRVTKRLSYSDVPTIVASEDDDGATRQMLVLAKDVALALLDNRRRRGGMALYDLARMMVTDEEGNLIQFKSRSDTIGHIIVQEAMILANRAVAQFCVDRAIPVPFRNHEAKHAKPPSEQLAATIEQWAKQGTATIQQIQQQFHMIAGKARYGAEARGHHALCLSSYVHASSPLRRFADLVVQRQIRAHLEGRPLPYTHDSLTALAEHLNEAIERRKEERVANYQERVRSHAVSALDAGRASSMADHEVLAALKVARNARSIPPALEEELIRRMEAGILSDGAFDCLLVEIPLECLSADLTAAYAAAIERRPPLAMHLLTHAQVTGFIAPFKIEGSDGAPFEAHASVTRIATGDAYEGYGTGMRKREAEQSAAVGALLSILGLPRPIQPRPVATSPVSRPSPADHAPRVVSTAAAASPPNSRGTLNTMCQRLKITEAVFECRSTGPSHQPTFTAQAYVVVQGQRIHASAAGTTRKSAENDAAFALIANIKQKG